MIEPALYIGGFVFTGYRHHEAVETAREFMTKRGVRMSFFDRMLDDHPQHSIIIGFISPEGEMLDYYEETPLSLPITLIVHGA